MPAPVRKIPSDAWLGLGHRQRDHQRAADVEGAVLVEERHRLLVRQRVAPRGGIVGDVASGGLVDQPLADVALARVGLLRQLRRRQRLAASHRAVEAELVADHRQRDADRRGAIGDDFADERAGLLGVELGGNEGWVDVLSLRTYRGHVAVPLLCNWFANAARSLMDSRQSDKK